MTQDELGQPAVILSPHFDDETLGCGGTILRKRAAGADLALVFLTDGSRSHSDWISEQDLAERRRAEGINAAVALGIRPEDVHMLGLPETRLIERVAEATARLSRILSARRPAQIFLPYRHDLADDHEATFRIGEAAIRDAGLEVAVFEYVIWAWERWPWMARPGRHRLGWRESFRRFRDFVRLVRDIQVHVQVSDVLDRKWQALQAHRTQMERPAEHSDWPILSDVSHGGFLPRFFTGVEYFGNGAITSLTGASGLRP